MAYFLIWLINSVRPALIDLVIEETTGAHLFHIPDRRQFQNTHPFLLSQIQGKCRIRNHRSGSTYKAADADN